MLFSYTTPLSVRESSRFWQFDLIFRPKSIRADIGEAKNCVVIPVAALIEKNVKTYVYTLYDEETDTLDGLTEVTTGLSDGNNVQILSGISEGNKVYYRYADTIEYVFVRP